MINRINLVLALLLVSVVAMTAAIGVDYSQPNIEILPDMKYTPAWEAFAANPNFPNGQTMQPPVPGTIARGQLPLHYAVTKEEAVRAGQELTNPHSLTAIKATVAVEREQAPDSSRQEIEGSGEAGTTPVKAAEAEQALVRQQYAASIERGGEVYRTFCITCHGAKGAGDGPVTQRGFPPPPSLLTGKSLQMKDGQLFHILAYGQGSMDRFAAQLTPELRWDVINFVRDLQSRSPPQPATPPTAANAADGNGVQVEPVTGPNLLRDGTSDKGTVPPDKEPPKKEQANGT